MGGKLYTGADDGKVYCLNAETGELVWEAKAGIAGGAHVTPAFQVRSSPQVVGTTLFVGGMDGDLYALNTQNGQQRWKVHLADEGIAGSPTVVDGFVYIGDLYGNVSKLDAANGDILWQHRSDTSARRQCGTPVIAGDLCIIGRRQDSMRALNITDGSEVFTASLTLNTGSTPQMSTIAYRPSATVVVQNETNIGPGTGSTAYIVNSTTTDTFEMLYTSEGMHISAWALIREGTDIGGRYDSFIVNSTYAVRLWRGWVGHQCFSSTIVASSVDYRGDVLYVGDDAYGFTAFNATDGSYIYRYTTQGQVFSTPAIYAGAVYVTGQDGHLYVFKDQPSVEIEIRSWNNKGEQMYADEALEIHGRLVGVCEFTPEYPIHDPETFYPPIPGATVMVSFTNPDETTVDYSAVTDEDGFFMVEHVPTVAGACGWVVWYEGEWRPSGAYYETAYDEWHEISVVSSSSPDTEPEPDTEPPPTGALPLEYLYAAIAVIIIVVVALLAYFFLKRK
jgi:outer membrane protein assembly factor BamB